MNVAVALSLSALSDSFDSVAMFIRAIFNLLVMFPEHAKIELLASRCRARPVLPPVEPQHAHAYSSNGQ